ncbi:MAG TPA: AraC family transcriptional regulator [Pyrinomonadaceae bacterium]|jgi:AraC family transcriptional regulator
MMEQAAALEGRRAIAGSRLPLKQFPGVSATSRSLAGFRLWDLVYAPHTRVSEHEHEVARFCMAMRGACREIYGGKSRYFEPLTWDFLPAGNAHRLIVSRAGMCVFSIEIAPRWLEHARQYCAPVETPVHSKGGALGALLPKLYREYGHLDASSPLIIEGLVLEMLGEISRSPGHRAESRPPRWLRQVLDLLHEHFSERLQLSTIAQSVGVHPVHLAREFRRFHRCTVGEYARRLRVEYACRELASSKLSLAQIAFAAGFSDQSHFTRTFKHQTGMSPNQYRATLTSR